MGYICRTCARRATTLASSTGSTTGKRTFSQSRRTQRSYVVPQFPESSSAELNQVLSTFRNEHVLPSYLNENQKRLVYRQKYRSQIENNPVSVTFGSEDFELRPLDRQVLEKQRNSIIKQAIDMIAANREWQQVMPLLESVAAIGRVSVEETSEKLIRQAALQGHLGVVIQSLKAHQRTGLTLKDKYVLHGVLRGLRQTCEGDDWSIESVQKAIKYSEDVARLLTDKAHLATRTERERHASYARFNPLKDLSSIAIWLELRAVHAYKYGQGKDENGSVRSFYDRLAICFGTGDIPSYLNKSPLDINNEFFALMPVWQGILLSKKLLNSPPVRNAEALEDFANTAGEALSKTVSMLREQGTHNPGTYVHSAIKEYDLARKHIYSKDKFEPYERKQRVKVQDAPQESEALDEDIEEQTKS